MTSLRSLLPAERRAQILYEASIVCRAIQRRADQHSAAGRYRMAGNLDAFGLGVARHAIGLAVREGGEHVAEQTDSQADRQTERISMPQINPKADIVVEDGWYAAEIGETEIKDTKFGEKLMVPFLVEEAPGGNIIDITAFINISDHPKSNCVKWGEALFGKGKVFLTEDFDGQHCEVFVEEGEDTDGLPKNFIRKVRLPKGVKPQDKEPAGVAGGNEVTFDDIDF
jgi:hypothetical protein